MESAALFVDEVLPIRQRVPTVLLPLRFLFTAYRDLLSAGHLH
ncbi:MAG: hypothetical protein R3F41_11975 [Gammaproteobacteria bacterium]